MAVLLVLIEEAGESGDHRFVVGVAGGRGIGGGEEAAAEAVEIEALRVGERGGAHGRGTEERVERAGLRIGGGDLSVVDAPGLEEVLVGFKEGRAGEDAFVPNEHRPAIGGEDALKFGAGARGIEPMEGLAGGYEGGVAVGERGGFGAAVDRMEAGVGGELRFGGGAHGGVRLDGVDGVAVVEEEAGEDSGSGADVCDDGDGRQVTIALEEAEDLVGIGRTEADVIGDAVGEAGDGIGHGRHHYMNGAKERAGEHG